MLLFTTITSSLAVILMLLGVTQEIKEVTKEEDQECMEKRLSEEGMRFLKEQEGVMLEIYKDAGKLAGGVGHQLTREELKVWKKGQFIPECQVEEWLRNDVNRFERVVNNWVTKEISQSQFDALFSFAFNVGENAFKRSTLLKKLNRGDIEGAMKEFSRWKFSEGKVNPVLVARRAEEVKMFKGDMV